MMRDRVGGGAQSVGKGIVSGKHLTLTLFFAGLFGKPKTHQNKHVKDFMSNTNYLGL